MVLGLIALTNPVATLVFKTLICVKARDALIDRVIMGPTRGSNASRNMTACHPNPGDHRPYEGQQRGYLRAAPAGHGS